MNYVYDCLSFLDYMGKVKIEHGLKVRELGVYMFQRNAVQIPTWKEVKQRFSFLESAENLGNRDKEALYREKERKGKKIIDNDGFQNEIENYLLHGSTNGERTPLYMRYFNIEP